MKAIIKTIDDICELTIALYTKPDLGKDYFYFNEQSSLQALREVPSDTKIKVTNIFSERHRIAQKIGKIRDVTTVNEFLDIVLPLVENGNFPCTDITVIINDTIELRSHDDGEIHLVSSNRAELEDLAKKILKRQGYDIKLLEEISAKRGIYCKLEKPDKIISTYSSFEEVINSI
jgi:hypothetical protein